MFVSCNIVNVGVGDLLLLGDETKTPNMEQKVQAFSSPYIKLSMSFRHQKFTKSDRLVKKLSCNTGLHIILPVYILKILLARNYF